LAISATARRIDVVEQLIPLAEEMGVRPDLRRRPVEERAAA
jgi:hypothetical protein